MMKYKTRILALLMAAAMLLSVCGCAQSGDALERVLRRERIVFGIAPDSMPVSGGTQEAPTGISVDIGNEIAARLEVEAEYIFVAHEDALQSISEGVIDCYINLNEPDLRAAAQLRMIDTMFEWRQVAVVKSGAWQNQLVDLAGERLCVVSGSDANTALDSAELFKASMRGINYAENYEQVLYALNNSHCIAAVVDEMEFMEAAGDNRSSFVVIDQPLASSGYVLAFAYGATTLADRIQSIYDDMNADGTVGAIRAEWIG